MSYVREIAVGALALIASIALLHGNDGTIALPAIAGIGAIVVQDVLATRSQ